MQPEVERSKAPEWEPFQSLVPPEDPCESSAEFGLATPTGLQKQFARAVDAFNGNGFVGQVDDRQIIDLDETFDITSQVRITFLRLVPLSAVQHYAANCCRWGRAGRTSLRFADHAAYFPKQRDEIVDRAMAPLKDAPHEAAVEFEPTGLRIVPSEPSGWFAHALNHAAGNVLRRKLAFTVLGQWDSHDTPALEPPGFGLRVEYDVDFPANEQEVTGQFVHLLIRTVEVRFLDAQGARQRLRRFRSSCSAK